MTDPQAVRRHALPRGLSARPALPEEAEEAPYPALRHLVGFVEDGPSDLSERSGDKVRALLARRSGQK